MEKIFIDEFKSQLTIADYTARSFSLKLNRDATYISQILNNKIKSVQFTAAKIIFSELGCIEDKYMMDFLYLVGVKIPVNSICQLTYNKIENISDCYKKELFSNETEGEIIKDFTCEENKLVITLPQDMLEKLCKLSVEKFRTSEQQAAKIIIEYLNEL